MKMAYFSQDGRLAHLAAGDIGAISPDEGAIFAAVPDGTDPSAIYWDAGAAKVKYRAEIALSSDRTVLALGETATVTGATAGSMLEVDGETVSADGPVTVSAQAVGYIVVAPAINRRGDLVSIRVDLLAVLQDELRAERNLRLADCDWTDTASAPARLGGELHAAWLAYRQALRDVMNDQPEATIDTVVWPAAPGA